MTKGESVSAFRRPWGFLALAIIGLWYLAVTVPFINDYPIMDWPQVGIAAPAYKLSTQGVYGNDLFAGFHRTELRNYEYMPAYPLLVALSFKVFGLGVWQARLVSICAGLLTVYLTFWLGHRIGGMVVGVSAAAVLTGLRLSPLPGVTGIPLLDYARVIRYDILVPVFVLAACLAFLWPFQHRGTSPAKDPHSSRHAWIALTIAGIIAGLATLSHLYGAFVVATFAITLIWYCGWRIIRTPAFWCVPLGWSLAVSPWIVYVVGDLEAYRGQMTRHEGRFALFDIGFYLHNILREHHRYGPWVGGFPEGLLQPRLGIWLMIMAVGGVSLYLWKRLRNQPSAAHILALVALPSHMVLMALLLNLKRNVYTVVLLPFIAILVGIAATITWDWVRRHRSGTLRVLVSVMLLAVLLESAMGVRGMLASASVTTPYNQLTARLDAAVPEDSRLLISQPYWFGLSHHETRSINLVTVLERTSPIQDVMADIAPDYVIVERQFFDETLVNNERSWAFWSAFHRYLQARCPDVVFTLADRQYGTIDIWSCH